MPQTRAVDKQECGLGRCRGSHVNCVIVRPMAFTFCHVPIIYVLWSSDRGCYGRMELASGSIWAVAMGQKRAAWPSSCPRRALGVLAHQRYRGVGTAEPRRYQTGWPLNFFCARFHSDVCQLGLGRRRARGWLGASSSVCAPVCRPSSLPCSSQCVTCNPPVTFHPGLPHS